VTGSCSSINCNYHSLDSRALPGGAPLRRWPPGQGLAGFHMQQDPGSGAWLGLRKDESREAAGPVTGLPHGEIWKGGSSSSSSSSSSSISPGAEPASMHSVELLIKSNKVFYSMISGHSAGARLPLLAAKHHGMYISCS